MPWYLVFCINKVWCNFLRFLAPICYIWLERRLCGELTRRKAPKVLQALLNFLSRHYFDCQRKKLGLIKMASLSPKKVEVDQVLSTEFLVSFTVSSFSLGRHFFNKVSSVILMGKFCGQLGPNGPKLAQLTMQFWLVSSLATI